MDYTLYIEVWVGVGVGEGGGSYRDTDMCVLDIFHVISIATIVFDKS